MSRSRLGRRYRHLALPEVTLTPLIDTALTLLIIFMITTPMLQNSIKIDLPKGTVKEDGGAQQDLIVYIDKNNKVMFDNKGIKLAELVRMLSARVNTQKDKTVFVKADQSTNYGDVIKVVDAIKGIKGIAYVALATSHSSAAAA